MQYAVWSEFTPYHQLHSRLPELKANACALYLAIHASSYKNQELYEFLKAAQEARVEVRPWLLLDKGQGYWPNKWNLDVFSSFILSFLEECKHQGIKTEWLIFDLEPHIDLMLNLEVLLQSRRYCAAWKLIKSWGDNISWQNSQRQMTALVAEMHSRQIKIQVVTMPMVLDDLKIKGHKLQHMLGIPIEGIAWDEVTFMLYRPYFWDYLPKIGSRIVFEYAGEARALFGDRASVALGPIGPQGMTQSKYFFRKPEEIQIDINCAGPRISLFCLEGIEEQGSLDQFLISPCTDQVAIFDWRTALFRKAVRFGLGIL